MIEVHSGRRSVAVPRCFPASVRLFWKTFPWRAAASVAAVLLLASPGNSANYYVATNGSDTLNDGSSLSSALKTIQAAVDRAQYGDTILVAPGTYEAVQVQIAPELWTGPNRYRVEIEPYRDIPSTFSGGGLGRFPEDHPNQAPPKILPMPLTIKASDPSNRPVLKAFETVTAAWTPVDSATFDSLTGTTGQFNSANPKIYWVPWSNFANGNGTFRKPDFSPDSFHDKIHVVLEIDGQGAERALVQTLQTPWETVLSGGDFPEYYSSNGVISLARPETDANNQPIIYGPSQRMVPGTFQFRRDSLSNFGKLYVWRTDEVIPDTSGHKIEAFNPANRKYPAGVAPIHSLWGPILSRVPWVHLDGLILSGSNNTTSSGGGLTMWLGSKVENCDIRWMDREGVSMPGGIIRNCVISDSGQTGMSGFSNWFTVPANSPNTNGTLVIENTQILRSNWRRFSLYNHCGAIKIIGGFPCDNLRIQNNTIRDSFGPGIWFDTRRASSASPTGGYQRPLVTRNLIERAADGIFLEVSAFFDVQDNAVIDCPIRGIYVNGGVGNRVVNNTIVSREDNVSPDYQFTQAFQLPTGSTSTFFHVGLNMDGYPTRHNAANDPDDPNGVLHHDNLCLNNVVVGDTETADRNLIAALINSPNNSSWNYEENWLRDNLFWSLPGASHIYLGGFPSSGGMIRCDTITSFEATFGAASGQNTGNVIAVPVFRGPKSGEAELRQWELAWNSPKQGAGTMTDLDGDDLSDGWEEYWSSVALNGQPDYAYFTASNLPEFLGGDPIHPSGASRQFFADAVLGDVTWDGLRSTFQMHRRGPVPTIGQAFSKAQSGDTVFVAAGSYPNGNLNLTSKNVTVIIAGDVVIP